ncbi:MAG: hypothetical protein [Bacteriophage sp.]|nr:MAG: hypothetical protein [Bacteriophage sp.]
MRVTAKVTFKEAGEIKQLENGTVLQRVIFTEIGRDGFGDPNGKDEDFEVTIFGSEKIDNFNKMKEIRNSDKCEIKMYLNSRKNKAEDGREFLNLNLTLSSITFAKNEATS